MEIFKCDKGHDYLLWKECPFCCVLQKKIPNEKSASFLHVYEAIKSMNEKQVEEFYYKKYLPQHEPETPVNMLVFK